ncbi:SDR family NAD(P)-dependent oxidoreductase [Dactylosporangium sp. CS-033363]|uniref:SDR family NAD(P)-dependent oxidoreductase n=1 Tax=Dactylosporangium sp. CS-033363 TaxID=3239935 RepID=UPI003D90C33D
MLNTLDPAQSPALGAALGLAGETVLVTGATRGIGAALATGLARLGVHVVAVGRDKERLDALAASGLPIHPVAAEVTDEDEMAAAFDTAVGITGRLLGAVANAGIAYVQPSLDFGAEDFRRTLDVNVVGAFLTTRLAAQRLPGGGSVVLTSSTFSASAFDQWAAYSASKAAVSMLARSLGAEWAPRGVRVNAVGPTATLTDQNRDYLGVPENSAGIVARIPAGRLLEPEELVLPFAFLLSPKNQMITGQTLFVDGGWTLP